MLIYIYTLLCRIVKYLIIYLYSTLIFIICRENLNTMLQMCNVTLPSPQLTCQVVINCINMYLLSYKSLNANITL